MQRLLQEEQEGQEGQEARSGGAAGQVQQRVPPQVMGSGESGEGVRLARRVLEAA